MKIKEHQEKIYVHMKSLTSIPFGGPIGTVKRNASASVEIPLSKEVCAASTRSFISPEVHANICGQASGMTVSEPQGVVN